METNYVITPESRRALIKAIEKTPARSKWAKGVKEYAIELAEDLQDGMEVNTKNLLNGAKDWGQYSTGCCSLYYHWDIALRLCTSSELNRVRTGYNEVKPRPNSRETWFDVQARALRQAYAIVIVEALELQ